METAVQLTKKQNEVMASLSKETKKTIIEEAKKFNLELKISSTKKLMLEAIKTHFQKIAEKKSETKSVTSVKSKKEVSRMEDIRSLNETVESHSYNKTEADRFNKLAKVDELHIIKLMMNTFEKLGTSTERTLLFKKSLDSLNTTNLHDSTSKMISKCSRFLASNTLLPDVREPKQVLGFINNWDYLMAVYDFQNENMVNLGVSKKRIKAECKQGFKALSDYKKEVSGNKTEYTLLKKGFIKA